MVTIIFKVGGTTVKRTWGDGAEPRTQTASRTADIEKPVSASPPQLEEPGTSDGTAAAAEAEAEAEKKPPPPNEPGSGGRAAATAVAPPRRAGTRVLCWWRGQLIPVEIVERRELGGGGAAGYEYYVHYTQFDRRLDGWVRGEELILDSAETPADTKVGDKVTSPVMTRIQRRKLKAVWPAGHDEFGVSSLEQHNGHTRIKNIMTIELGNYEIDAWYYSPFPLVHKDTSKLYVCEFCLDFKEKKRHLQRHMEKCNYRHPPGNEIYRRGKLSIFEVVGEKWKVYTSNLCSLAKLFLEHKAINPKVELFLFYILCEWDDRGCHIVAYFSKEKNSDYDYNLSCILTLPPYQQKGYGSFLIEFSYELSKIERKPGSPEPPLSDLAQVAYKSYWTRALLGILKEKDENVSISIKELSDMTGIATSDVLNTLQSLNLITKKNRVHVICTNPTAPDHHPKPAIRRDLMYDANNLIWTPHHERS